MPWFLHHIFISHCCVFLLFMKFCCASHRVRHEKMKGGISISSEEIIRRRMLVDSYLAERASAEKDWIETYHSNLPESPFSPDIKKQKLPEIKDKLNILTVSKPTNNLVIPEIQNLGKLTHTEFVDRRNTFISSFPKLSNLEKEDSQESRRIFKEKEARSNKVVSDDKIISLKAKPQETLHQSSKLDEYDIENIHSIIKNYELNTADVSEKDSDFVTEVKSSKNVERGQLNSESIKRKLSPNIGPKAMDSHLTVNSNDGIVYHTVHSSHKTFKEKAFINYDAEIQSVSSAKATESGTYKTIKNNLKMNSQSSEIKDEQTGAEGPDVKFDEFLTKQEVPLINPELKNNVVKHKKEKIFNVSDNETETKTDSEFGKRKGDLLKDEVTFNSENSVTVEEIKDPSFSESTNMNEIVNLDNDFEEDGGDTFPVDPEILHRQQLVSQYLSKLNQDNKNWIETYYFDYMKHDHDENVHYSQRNIAQAEISSKQVRSSQERLYLVRWVNKLLQKFAGCTLSENNVLHFSFSVSLLNTLKTVSSSESFDIVMFDELLSGLIMNATLNNEYFVSNIIDNYIPSNVSIIYILAAIFLCVSLCYHRNIISYFRSLILLIVVILWHGFRMYQAKVTEKHAIISRVPSQYCESILSHESGVFAHIKEYFRWSYHDEDCRKYYTALMIDPLAEITPSAIILDFVSSCISHLILPFGSVINNFYKELTSGLWFYQIPMIIVFLFVICCIGILIYSIITKREVTLPFGCAIKPTVLPIGSKVEDVVLDKQEFFLQNSPKKYNIPLITCHSHSKNNFLNNTFILETKSISPIREKCCVFQSSKYLSQKMHLHRRASF